MTQWPGDESGSGSRLLSLLLRLLPRAFRARFGDEMEADFRARRAEAGGAGGGVVVRLWLRTTLDLVGTAGREWSGVLVQGARTDARIALRGWVKRPVTAAAVVLTLGLALAATTTVFALAQSVLVAPMPYGDPDRLALMWMAPDEDDERRRPSGPEAAAAAGARSVVGVGFLQRVDNAVALAPDPAPVRVARVNDAFFRVLGVTPTIGRDFRQGEVRTAAGGAVPSAVWLASDAFFRSVLGGDARRLGSSLSVDGVAGVVVGVLPRDFRLLLPPGSGVPAEPELYAALGARLEELPRADRLRDQDSDDTGFVIARVAAGASLAAFESEVAALLRAALPPTGPRPVPRIRWLRDEVVVHARPVLHALAGAAALVLLLACASTANQLLARTGERGTELSVRASLGATRVRLIRQLAVEAVMLVAAAAGLGVALSWLLLAAVAAARPDALPALPLRPAGMVLGGAVLVSLPCALLAGVAPVFHPAVRRPVGAGSRVTGSRRLRAVRRGLISVQVALSLALLASTGLLLRTAAALHDQELGFATGGVVTFRTALVRRDAYRGPADRAAFVAALEARIRAIAGVRSVGVVAGLPLDGRTYTQRFEAGDLTGEANVRVVSAGFFDALGTRVLEGRGFRPEDDRQDRRVVIADAALARAIAPGGTALGRSIRLPMDGAMEEAVVVGVVERVRYESLTAPERPTAYVPYRHEASRQIAFVVRAAGSPRRTLDEAGAAVRSLDPRLALFDARTLDSLVARELAPRRFALRVLAGFGLLATLVALVGLHGTVRQTIHQRRRELGLRIALGARPLQVLLAVAREGLEPGLIGIAAGLPAALALALALRALLFGVEPTDTHSLAAAAAALTLLCALTCAAAARAALRIDPARSLSGD